MNRLLHRWPLWIQIWLVFVVFALLCLTVTMMLTPRVLTSYFTDEVYGHITHAQQQFIEEIGALPPQSLERGDRRAFDGPHEARLSSRTVRHVVINADAPRMRRGLGTREVGKEQWDIIVQQARVQTTMQQTYAQQVDKDTLFYVVARMEGKRVFVVSYMWNTYLDGLVHTLYERLLVLFVTVLLLSMIPSIWLARYVSRPLAALAQSVMRIADRHWHEPINIARGDEIGHLAMSIDKMRQRLKAQDDAQQRMLQHVSHELKTPVMIIQSYAQSMRDHVYPQGSVDGSIDVIAQEAERLQKRVHDLLYMTRLQYLAYEPMRKTRFDLHALIHTVTKKFHARRTDIVWNTVLDAPNMVEGDKEQWTVAIENVLDNAVRYAQTCIRVSWWQCVLSIENDGVHLTQEVQATLFHTFAHGADGQFGLGLAIAMRIAESHGVELTCENVAGGVAFRFVWGGSVSE